MATLAEYKEMPWTTLREKAKSLGVTTGRKFKGQIILDCAAADSDAKIIPEVGKVEMSRSSLAPPANPSDSTMWFMYEAGSYRAYQNTRDSILVVDKNQSNLALFMREGNKVDGGGRIILPFRMYAKLFVDMIAGAQ